VLYPWTTIKDMYGSRWSSALSRESMDAAIAIVRGGWPGDHARGTTSDAWYVDDPRRWRDSSPSVLPADALADSFSRKVTP